MRLARCSCNIWCSQQLNPHHSACSSDLYEIPSLRKPLISNSLALQTKSADVYMISLPENDYSYVHIYDMCNSVFSNTQNSALYVFLMPLVAFFRQLYLLQHNNASLKSRIPHTYDIVHRIHHRLSCTFNNNSCD